MNYDGHWISFGTIENSTITFNSIEKEISKMELTPVFDEFIAHGKTLPEAYHEALWWLHKNNYISDCTDWDCKQMECSMMMIVEEPLAEPMISRLFIGGTRELQQYVMEMLDGILDFEIEKGNWKYTYHDRFKDQISFVISELKRNPSSRRAIMSIRTPDDIGSDDPACLQSIQYLIRDGKLHCKVMFRSNDACKATFMNAFALIMLQNRIADELGIEVGSYTHRANSFHCYEKDFDMLNNFVKRINEAEESGELEDITFEYVDDWKEQMEAEIPAILAQVEELKNR